jgi:hypothetical protein
MRERPEIVNWKSVKEKQLALILINEVDDAINGVGQTVCRFETNVLGPRRRTDWPGDSGQYRNIIAGSRHFCRQLGAPGYRLAAHF